MYAHSTGLPHAPMIGGPIIALSKTAKIRKQTDRLYDLDRKRVKLSGEIARRKAELRQLGVNPAAIDAAVGAFLGIALTKEAKIKKKMRQLQKARADYDKTLADIRDAESKLYKLGADPKALRASWRSTLTGGYGCEGYDCGGYGCEGYDCDDDAGEIEDDCGCGCRGYGDCGEVEGIVVGNVYREERFKPALAALPMFRPESPWRIGVRENVWGRGRWGGV